MTQIFIFTAGQSAARAHLDDSIISPIDLSKLEGNFLESTGEEDNLMNRKELENFVGVSTIYTNSFESSMAQFFFYDKKGILDHEHIYTNW